jgi:DNA polymerase III subunit delta
VNDAALIDALDSGVRTWLVTGDGGPLVEHAVDTLIAWGKARCGPPQFNLLVAHLGDSAAGVGACSTARTLPMLGDLRVVVLRELEAGDEASFAALAAYVAEPSASTLLIATGTAFPAARKGGSAWSTRIPKALGPTGRALKVSKSDVSPAFFARERARAFGKELGAREASVLVEIVGKELGALACEVEKLATYVGDEPAISMEAIQAASTMLAEAVGWDLTAAIAARKPDTALAALHRLLESGDSAHRLLGLLLWQMRQLLQVAELAHRPVPEICAATSLRPDQVVRLKDAIGKERPSTSAMLERIARANRDMNDHRAGDRRVFEALVVDLTCR